MSKANASSDSGQGSTTVSPSSKKTSASTPTQRTYRFQVFCFVGVIVLILLIAWLSSYVVAYTSDAYIDTNVVTVSPQVSGRVDHVYVKDNQAVKQGQLLFSLDPRPFQIDVQSAQSSVQSAQAQIDIDKANMQSAEAQYQSDQAALHLANLTLKRNQTLASQGAYSHQSLDRAQAQQREAYAAAMDTKADLTQEKATLQYHQAKLGSAQSDLALAQWHLSRTRVYASVDGHVTNVTLEKGDMASADNGAMALASGDSWRVIANYKEYLIRHLSPGHTVWVWIDASPWHLYRAHVTGIAHAISRQEKPTKLVPYVSPTVDWIRLSHRIPVRIELEHPPAEMYSGSDARVIAVY